MVMAWICSNYDKIIQSVIMLTGFFAIYQYKSQKINERKTACTLILNQIDETEKIINKLREAESDITVLHKVPNLYEENYWEKSKVLLIRVLNESDINVLDSYYSTMVQIQKGKTEISTALENTWKWRSLGVNLMSKELVELTDESEKMIKIDNLNKYIKDSYSFKSQVGVDILTEGLANFKSIKCSTTYTILEKKSFRKK